LGKHARLGPSNARWPNCPGSVREEANYVDVSGEAAIDGTGSHELLELCLKNGVQAVQYDQQIICPNHPEKSGGWLVAMDRVDRVQMCLDYIYRRVHELSKQYPESQVSVESETKSNPGALAGRDDWWGTVDVTITCRNKMTGVVHMLEVVDYKDGRGYVNHKDNTQLVSYLVGKLLTYVGSGELNTRPHDLKRVEHCRYTIVQPKTNPVIRYQCSKDGDISVTSVIEHGDRLAVAAAKTDHKDAPVSPGKWCQWCKANPKRGGHCGASVDKSIKVLHKMSDDKIYGDQLDKTPFFEQVKRIIADPSTLSPEELSGLMSAKEPLMAAFDKCQKEIEKRIGEGTPVNGFAMKPGRSSRVWNIPDDEMAKKLKARKMLLDDIYPKKLISVPQLMKSDKLTDKQKERIEDEFVETKAGKMTLQKVAHSQKESVSQSDTDVLHSAKEMFEGVQADEQTANPQATKPAPISFM